MTEMGLAFPLDSEASEESAATRIARLPRDFFSSRVFAIGAKPDREVHHRRRQDPHEMIKSHNGHLMVARIIEEARKARKKPKSTGPSDSLTVLH